MDGVDLSMTSSSHRPQESQLCLQTNQPWTSFRAVFVKKGARGISRAVARTQTWFNCAVQVGFTMLKSARAWIHMEQRCILNTSEECAPLQTLVSANVAPLNVINVVQSCWNRKQSQNDHCAKFGFLIVHWITSVFSLVAQSAGKGLFEISRLSPFRGKHEFPGDVGSALHHGARSAVAWDTTWQPSQLGGSANPGPISEGCNASTGKKCSGLGFCGLVFFVFNLQKIFYLL